LWWGLWVFLASLLAFGQTDESEKKKSAEDALEDEMLLQEEGDFPDLVGVDETGGIVDEFALLEEELSADEVKSVSKHRQSIFWSASAVNVITKEEIRSSGANSISDILRRIPGFDVYEMKPSFPLVGARALTEDTNNLILLLVDGREALIELAGFPIWSALTIDVDEVERIEVIRGPGSTLYGANAFAGVVSITTVADRHTTGGEVSLAAGNQGEHRLFGRVRGTWELGGGTLDLHLGAGTGGRLSPSDKHDEIIQADLRSHGYLRYRLGRRLDASLQAGILVGAGPLYLLVGDFHVNDVLNHWVMGKAEVSLSKNVSLKAQLYHIRFLGSFHYRSIFKAYGVWLANVPDFTMDTPTLDGQVQVDVQISDRLLLTGGGNIRYTTLESDMVIPPELSELRGAGFVHAQWHPWGPVQLTGGLRLDLNSETEMALSPRAVVVYRPWPDQSFRLGYSLAFRKPSFVERQMHFKIEEAAFQEVVDKLKESVGNEALVNEKVHSVEAGWLGRFLDEELLVSLDLFYNVYVDMIYFKNEMAVNQFGAPDIANSTFQFRNRKTDIHAVGGEAQVAWSPAPAWTLWGNLGLRRVTYEDGGHLSSEPALRVNLGCRYNSDAGPRVDLAIHYVSSLVIPFILPEKPFEDPDNVSLGNSVLAVVRLGYRLGTWKSLNTEVGLIARAPIGPDFREFPGIPFTRSQRSVTGSDFGGELLVRLVSLYLRGSF
jgi:iron complex outermembrane receptor protein